MDVAGKSAVLARDDPARDALFRQVHSSVHLAVVLQDAEAPYTPDAAPSVERSFSAQVFAELPTRAVSPDAAHSELLESPGRQKP